MALTETGDEQPTIVDAVIAAARQKGISLDRRRWEIAALLADMRVEVVTDEPSRIWLHHPHHADVIVNDGGARLASPRKSAEAHGELKA